MKSGKRVISVGMVGLLLLLLLSLAVSGSAIGESSKPKHLKVGTILPLSGPLSAIGLSFLRGLEMAFDDMNAQGGMEIGGEQYLFDLLAEDDKYNPELAATAAIKLVDKEGVGFLVAGPVTDAGLDAMYRVTAPAKSLLLMCWIVTPGGPTDVGPDRTLTVRLNPGPLFNIIPIYEYLLEAYPDVKTVALFIPEAGMDYIPELVAAVESTGVSVVGKEWFPMQTVDFVPLVTRCLERKPDAVQVVCSGQAGIVAKAFRDLGFKGPIISDSPMSPDIILAQTGPAAGTDIICGGPAMYSENTPAHLVELRKKWEAKYTDVFDADGIVLYDVALSLFRALEKADSVDPEKVAKAFEALTAEGSIQTAYGPAQMGGQKTFGVNRVLIKPYPISIIRNGKADFVKYVPAPIL